MVLCKFFAEGNCRFGGKLLSRTLKSMLNCGQIDVDLNTQLVAKEIKL